MPELIPTASEAGWLEARRKGVTASEIAVIMGLSPYSSPYKLWHQKAGILPPDPQTEVQELGHVLEPYIAGKFAGRHPEFYVEGDGETLYAHDERPWQMATPDRLVHPLVEVNRCTCGADLQMHYGHEPRCGQELDAPVAVLECKKDGGSPEWGEEGSDQVPGHYTCQVIWQMDVMGVGTAYVACLGRDSKVREYVVEMDDAARHLLEVMLKHARDFLDSLDLGQPPDVDWRPATLDALKSLHPSLEDREVLVGAQTASRWLAADRNEKHWKRRKKLYEAHLRDRMGSARRAVTADGQLIARRDVYPVREHVRKATTVDKLVPLNPERES